MLSEVKGKSKMGIPETLLHRQTNRNKKASLIETNSEIGLTETE